MNRRRIRVAAVALMILVVIGLTILWYIGDFSGGGVDRNIARVETELPVAEGPVEEASGRADADSAAVETPPEVMEAESAEGSSRKEESSLPPGLWPFDHPEREIVLRFVDSETGQHVGGLNIAYSLESAERLREPGLPDVRSGYHVYHRQPPQLDHIGVTTRDGAVRLNGERLPRDARVIRVRVLDSSWTLETFVGEGRLTDVLPSNHPREFVASFMVPQHQWEFRLYVRRAIHVDLNISFSDGAPFRGVVHVASGMPDVSRSQWLQQRFFADDESRLELGSIGHGHSVHVQVEGWRLGFKARQEFQYEGREVTSELNAVVTKEDAPQARLVVKVDGSDTEPHTLFDIYVRGEHGNFVQPGRLMGSGTYETIRVPPGRPFFVTVYAPRRGLRWDTEGHLEPLEPNETRVLHAVPGETVSVRARVVNQQGEPLNPAIMMLGETRYAVWHVIKRRPDLSSGENGVVQLRSAPTGRRTFTVEALGYQPRTVTAELHPGVDHDFGDIVLYPAQGVIHVILENYDPDATYVAWLVQPGVTVLTERQEVIHGTLTLSDLPFRQYDVFVSGGSGLRGRSSRIRLVQGQSEVTVRIDVADLPTQD
jgi:hypothetical protein